MERNTDKMAALKEGIERAAALQGIINTTYIESQAQTAWLLVENFNQFSTVLVMLGDMLNDCCKAAQEIETSMELADAKEA